MRVIFDFGLCDSVSEVRWTDQNGTLWKIRTNRFARDARRRRDAIARRRRGAWHASHTLCLCCFARRRLVWSTLGAHLAVRVCGQLPKKTVETSHIPGSDPATLSSAPPPKSALNLCIGRKFLFDIQVRIFALSR